MHIRISVCALLLGLGSLFGENVCAASYEPHTITLDEAIETALMNHPRLKKANAEIERARASRGEVWDGGNTSFSYSWGQLNGEFKKDNELSVEQSLGSFLTPFYKNALVNSQVANGKSYRDMVKKEIIAEVKRAWVYYQYAKSTYALYASQDELASKLKQSGELRYLQGDIDLAEKNMIAAMAANIHTLVLQWREELALAGKRFKWACYSDKDIIPTAEEADEYGVLKTMDEIGAEALLPSLSHLDYFAGQVNEKKNLLKMERSKFFPEFSVGYNRQKIYPLKNLNSWIVGVSFPILFYPQHSRSKQAKIDLKIAEWEALENKSALSNKIEEIKGRLRQQNESLEYFSKAALKEAESLQNSTMLKFEESDIDITEFVQNLSASREIQKSYLETLYNYNISILELELYTD